MVHGTGDGGSAWQRGAAVVICLAAGAVGLWLLFRPLLGIALPFLLAYLLSRPIRAAVERLCRRGRMPRSLISGGLVVLSVGGTVFLLWRGIRRGVGELSRLLSALAADKDGVLSALGRLLERTRSLSLHIPFLRHFEDTPGYADFCTRLDAFVSRGIDRLGEWVSSQVPGAAMAVAGRVPDAFIFIMVTLLSCYYFSADDGRIGRAVSAAMARWLPASWQESLPAIGRRLRRLGREYARAYLLLGLFTFLEVFIGLSILGIRYAFLLAWLIALVDFLPLLGTGVVLVPWGIVSLLLGETRVGVGLLILFGVCTLLRQLAEPRLFGQGLGVHPLLALLSTYAGLRLFGVAGMLLAPLVAAGVKRLLLGE